MPDPVHHFALLKDHQHLLLCSNEFGWASLAHVHIWDKSSSCLQGQFKEDCCFIGLSTRKGLICLGSVTIISGLPLSLTTTPVMHMSFPLKSISGCPLNLERSDVLMKSVNNCLGYSS